LATTLLDRAKKNKADEFYTQLPDIEKELRHCHPNLKWYQNHPFIFTTNFNNSQTVNIIHQVSRL